MKRIFTCLVGLLLTISAAAQPLCLSPEELKTHQRLLDKAFAPETKLFPDIRARQMQIGGIFALSPEERRFRLAPQKFEADFKKHLRSIQSLKETRLAFSIQLYLHPDGRPAHFSCRPSEAKPSAEQEKEVQAALCLWLKTYRYPFVANQPYRVMVYARTSPESEPPAHKQNLITTLEQLRQTSRPDTVKRITLVLEELTEVPEELYRFTNVEVVSLAGNKLTQIPEALFALPRLKRLDLTGNRLTENSFTIPPGSGLTFLNLQYNQLTRVPASVANCRHLTSLWLGHNKLVEVNTDVLRKLKRLEDLNLYSAGLNQLPAGIGKLKRLQILDLYYNNLRELPAAICRLRRLQQLAVSENKLGNLPKKLHRMRRLEKIYAHHNFLASLPERLHRSRRLQLLDIGYNAFRHVPAVVSRIKTLHELDMGHNRLTELPASLANLPNLEKCYVRGNPLPAELPVVRKLEARKTEVFH